MPSELAQLVADHPDEAAELIASLPRNEREAIQYAWSSVWARPAQKPPPGEWWTWLLMGGRGVGKTRSGSEFVRIRREGGSRRMALIAETAADCRDVIVEGKSGILACSPPWDMPVYEPSKRRLTWKATSRYPWETQAILFSGDKPSQLRGPQFDTFWADEFAKYKRSDQLFGILDPAVRLGDDPRGLVTTTPIPSKAMRELVKDPDTVTVVESTFANAANLPKKTIDRLRRRYDGTRLGRQELYGELLEDVEGALWTHALIDKHRAKLVKAEGAPARPGINAAGWCWMVYDFDTGIFRPVPDFVEVVVAVDPAVTAGPDSDDTGIIVVARGTDDHVYILGDHTCHLPPQGWAKQAGTAFYNYEADLVIGEVNNGGDLVKYTMGVYDQRIPFDDVRASRGKITRAGPVATACEKGHVHHLGSFPKLEDEMCTYVPGEPSPDRMDAMVWGATRYVGPMPGPGIY